MIRPLGGAVLAILTLSACAPVSTIVERWFPPEAAGATRPAANSATRPAVGSAEAPPLPRRKPKVISEVAEVAEVAEVIEVTLAGADPQRLVGLDFDGTKALLGNPAAKMEQPPAKVWAYAGGRCMFSVFFFPSVDDRVFRVLAIEVTDEVDILGLRWLRDPPDATPKAPPKAPKVMDQDDPVVRRCFADLLQNQQTPNAG
jgi:hypothetical protein